MIKRLMFAVVLSFMLMLSSCGGDVYCELTFFSMDTVVTIKAEYGNETVLNECRDMILALEKRLSKTDTESDIFAINHTDSGTAVSDDTLGLIGYSLHIADVTDGRFSPALGRLTALWDFKNAVVPDVTAVSDALAHCGFKDVSVVGGIASISDDGLLIDLGGIAKGYICEAAVKYLYEHGVGYGIVNIGGNIGVFGDNPSGNNWTVGIKDPSLPSSLIGAIEVDGGYVAVSGDYERYFEADGVRYHHIIDPSTGYPSDNGVRSAAVWSNDGALCDALSTALFVGGADYALELYDSNVFEFEAVIVTDDGVVVTDGIAGRFTLY